MDRIKQSIHSKQVFQEEKRKVTIGRGSVYEDMTIYPLITNGNNGAVIRIDDVTDQVRMEEIMIQSEKMLSIGGLAAGMAHEINNPMAGLLQTALVMNDRLLSRTGIEANRKAAEKAGTTMKAVEEFMNSRRIPGMISSIIESGQRISEIVENMLSFARKSESIRSSYYINDLIEKTLELARTDYDLKKQYDFKQIKITRLYSDSLPPVLCENAKIQQVLLNILRNGAQAMQEAGTENPELIIETSIHRKKGMVSIKISDIGPGMDEKVRKRIFEPFFTTKPAGIGTGLGLSVSNFIIVEDHGGEMEVQSAFGKGTHIIIRLPVE